MIAAVLVIILLFVIMGSTAYETEKNKRPKQWFDEEDYL